MHKATPLRIQLKAQLNTLLYHANHVITSVYGLALWRRAGRHNSAQSADSHTMATRGDNDNKTLAEAAEKALYYLPKINANELRLYTIRGRQNA